MYEQTIADECVIQKLSLHKKRVIDKEMVDPLIDSGDQDECVEEARPADKSYDLTAGRAETFLEDDFEDFETVNPQSEWRVRWTRRLINPVYIGVITFVNLGYSLFLLAADSQLDWKIDHFTGIITIAMFINIYFLLHTILNFVVLGPTIIWNEKKVLYFELLTQGFFFVYLFRFLLDEQTFSKYSIFSDLTLITLLRNVRVFHYFVEAESVKVMTETTRHVTKPILGQFLFIYLVFYGYAQLGGILFSGDLTYHSFAVSGAPDFYYLMSFNDFGCALVTMFHQLVINNWFITVDMYTSITGTSWVKLYFISFWVILVLIMFNVFIAIILEIHGSVSEIVR